MKQMSASERAAASGSGIIRVTQGPTDLVAPRPRPNESAMRYGLGFPFAIGPKQAAIFCNLRNEGHPVGDFENGTDVVLFDDLDRISADHAVPVCRNDTYTNPQTGEPRIVIKHTAPGAFVPLGTKRADGSPHPHAGTGFAINQANDYPMKPGGIYDKADKGTKMVRQLEVHQLVYDGALRVLKTETKDRDDPLRPPGSALALMGVGLREGIPDGDDLLYPMQATTGDAGAWNSLPAMSGVSRWRRLDDQWQPVAFYPVVSSDDPSSAGDGEKLIYGTVVPAHWGEASLVRDIDGALLFSARGVHGRLIHQLRVWRSTDGGENWQVIIDLPDGRSQAPVTINQAVDGTPYVVANKRGRRSINGRDWLCLFPLKPDRNGLEEPITVRDATSQFGVPPSDPQRRPRGEHWFVDHPTAAVVHLADGEWHNVLAYRIMDRGEHAGADPAPQSGLYLEEVFSSGAVRAPWRFD